MRRKAGHRGRAGKGAFKGSKGSLAGEKGDRQVRVVFPRARRNCASGQQWQTGKEPDKGLEALSVCLAGGHE